jgi:hypothetical protein
VNVVVAKTPTLTKINSDHDDETTTTGSASSDRE